MCVFYGFINSDTFQSVLRFLRKQISRMFQVKVFLQRDLFISIPFHYDETVSDLKTRISSSKGLLNSQQVLIYKGKVMEDEFSLCYYGLKDNSKIFIVLRKDKSNSQSRPVVLFDKLCDLLGKLVFCSISVQENIVNQISYLLTNPVLEAYSRINPSAKKMMEDAVLIIESIEPPLSQRTADYIARSNDLQTTKYERTREGFEVLLARMQNEFDSSDFDQNTLYPTNLSYESSLQDRPLPLLWDSRGERLFKDFLSNTIEPSFSMRLINILKNRYAREINLLKKMGFNDEKDILKALSEANGNINKAAQILQSNTLFE